MMGLLSEVIATHSQKTFGLRYQQEILFELWMRLGGALITPLYVLFKASLPLPKMAFLKKIAIKKKNNKN
jgi:hypothetical protein